MGCEMSCDRPHARTECLINEALSVYSVLVRSDRVLWRLAIDLQCSR